MNGSSGGARVEQTVRARPAHGHRGVLGWPSAFEREVFDGRYIVEVPLKECHVRRGGYQRVVVLAISHRERHLVDDCGRLVFVVGVVIDEEDINYSDGPLPARVRQLIEPPPDGFHLRKTS